MDNFLLWVRDGDVFSIAVIAGILSYIVKHVLQERRSLRQTGVIVGLVVALVVFWLCLDKSPIDTQPLVPFVLRSCLIGYIAAALSSLMLFVLSFLYDCIFSRPIAFVRRLWQVQQSKYSERKKRQASEKRRKESELERQKNAPFEEQRRKEAAARQLQMEQDSARRREARARCELLYSLHKFDIQDRFKRASLDEYMQKYMNDNEPPEAVERRAVELKAVIEKHCELKGISEKPQSIDQLALWFIDEKTRIEALPLDETMRATHIAHLNMRYAELSQEILESIRP